MSSNVRSVMVVTTASLLWVVGALIVAFPSQALSLKIGAIVTMFANTPEHSSSILALWILDVVIAVSCLRDTRIKASIVRWLGTMLVSVLIFFVAVIFVPLHDSHSTADYTLWLGIVGLMGLLVARGLSYAAPEKLISLPATPPGPAPSGTAGP